MKKSCTILYFLLFISCFSYSQSGWNTIVDNNNLYINGSPIRALNNSVANNMLLIGGKVNKLTNTTGGDCCNFPLYLFKNNIFITVDCEPLAFPDSVCILTLSSAIDSIYNQNLSAVGGLFNDQACIVPPTAVMHNLEFYETLSPTLYAAPSEMSCSDTVFAVATIADYDNPCFVTPDYYFRTYVASKCVFCQCSSPSTIDSNRYIAFYDPMRNCNTAFGGINYMQGGTNGPVYAIQAIDTANIYAGGKFDSAGVIKANNIAKWNGASWDSLGSGVNGTVKTLLAYNGKLYAGGNFSTAGGITANNIAVWNGSSWSALGTGTNGTVYALTIHNGNLYAGGGFTQAGGNTVNNIAKWDGANWSALAGGRNNEVYTLASFQGKLYAGGNFTGGANDTARYIARYDSTVLSVSEINSSSFSIYPNPSNGIFTITTGQSAIKNIEVINVLGEKVYWLDAHTLLNHTSTIDLSSQPNGVYFLKLNNEPQSIRKIIKL